MDTYTDEQLAFLLQFTHLERLHGDMPGVNETNIAAFWGIEPEKYRQFRLKFAQNVQRAAEELLADASFQRQVLRLPFSPGAAIVGVGDSITDDYQSWLEILTRVLEVCRPKDRIKVINLAISGDTTAHLISRFLAAVQAQPEWILCMIGTNDARRHGLQPSKILVSLEETQKNLRMLRNFAETQSEAKWAWITPSTVIEEKIPAHWYLGQFQMAWKNAELAEIAAVVRQMPDPVIDLQKIFGLPPDPRMLLDDGLHPSLEGQKSILRALVECLS